MIMMRSCHFRHRIYRSIYFGLCWMNGYVLVGVSLMLVGLCRPSKYIKYNNILIFLNHSRLSSKTILIQSLNLYKLTLITR